MSWCCTSLRAASAFVQSGPIQLSRADVLDAENVMSFESRKGDFRHASVVANPWPTAPINRFHRHQAILRSFVFCLLPLRFLLSVRTFPHDMALTTGNVIQCCVIRGVSEIINEIIKARMKELNYKGS